MNHLFESRNQRNKRILWQSVSPSVTQRLEGAGHRSSCWRLQPALAASLTASAVCWRSSAVWLGPAPPPSAYCSTLHSPCPEWRASAYVRSLSHLTLFIACNCDCLPSCWVRWRVCLTLPASLGVWPSSSESEPLWMFKDRKLTDVMMEYKFYNFWTIHTFTWFKNFHFVRH